MAFQFNVHHVTHNVVTQDVDRDTLRQQQCITYRGYWGSLATPTSSKFHWWGLSVPALLF